MSQIEDSIAYMLEKHGPPSAHGPMPEASVARFGPLVPEFLRTVWARFGRFSWFDGLFRAIDPARYTGVLRAALAGDPDLDPDRMVPLALGGAQTLDTFRPAAAPEAIALMHQAEPLVLVDLTTPAARQVRRVGRQG